MAHFVLGTLEKDRLMFRMVNVCARRAMVVAFSVMLGSVTANAQTVVDATTAEFEPSADHNTVRAERRW